MQRLIISLLCLLYGGLAWTGDAPLPPTTPDTVDSVHSRDMSALRLGAVNAAVVDMRTGGMIYSKNSDIVVPIASLTKLMTAMVVLDSKQPLEAWIAYGDRPQIDAKNAYTRIRVGSKLKRRDVLRLALMSSENYSAYTLGLKYPGGLRAFVNAMNKKATTLGMSRTQFVEPTGLSIDNRSTAHDLALMVRAAYDYPDIRKLSTVRNYTANFRKPRYKLAYGNTNSLVHRKHWSVSLSKTGYLSEAGRCLMMVTEIAGREVGMVFLDAFGKRTPLGDAGRIKRWLTNGTAGKVAGAALRYEQEKTAALKASM